jgi:hypothetical protein
MLMMDNTENGAAIPDELPAYARYEQWLNKEHTEGKPITIGDLFEVAVMTAVHIRMAFSAEDTHKLFHDAATQAEMLLQSNMVAYTDLDGQFVSRYMTKEERDADPDREKLLEQALQGSLFVPDDLSELDGS